MFRRHDSDNSGFLDAEEMMAALQDLGMLEGMKARQLGAHSHSQAVTAAAAFVCCKAKLKGTTGS